MELEEQKQLYLKKNNWLKKFYEEVTPVEFYRGIFPESSFERQGQQIDLKANGIITVIEKNDDKDVPFNLLVFDDLKTIKDVEGYKFVIMSPLAYFGKNRTAENARYLYGFAIDLDGVGMSQLNDLFFQIKNGLIPEPTYVVNSGTGLHLYFVLQDPIALYPNVHYKLKEFKYGLIEKIWNRYTSTFKERNEVQYQGIFQGFRVPGTASKLGVDYPVVAFDIGKKVTVEYLNGFLMDKSKALTDICYQSKLNLRQAKEKYPDWYQTRIVEGRQKGRWVVKRDLYDWWLRKIKEGSTVGHRYYCMSVLAVYAVKCNIDEDELHRDAMELLPYLDGLTTDESNRFTKKDILDAMKLYNESYVYYSRAEVERVSGISVPPNKRNYQKQAWHLEDMRIRKQTMRRRGQAFKNPEGRPSFKKDIERLLFLQPDITKQECAATLECSYQTVCRYWPERGAAKPKKVNNGAASIVRAFRKENTKAGRRECAESTGLGYSTVCKYWNN